MADNAKRSAILDRARRAVSAGTDDAARRAVVAGRIVGHKPNLIPARANLDAAGQIALFRQQAEAVQTTISEVAGRDDIPAAIANYLRSQNLPQAIRHGADERITGLPWKKGAPSLERQQGPADPLDQVSLSHAVAGIAETGTLVLTSGPANPTTLNFLPETHIVIVRASDITGTYEDVWQKLRSIHGERLLPRVVNMITGPSRTADIEQRIELGAHGPRRLHIVIVGD